VAKDRASGTRSTNRVTGAQVAREANVDPAIVSKLLQGNSSVRVSRETRKRVMDAVDRLGYRPNYAAQRLRSSRIGAIGLVIPDFRNPAFAEIVHGAEAASHERGISLFVSSSAESISTMDLVVDLVASDRVDALLVAGGSSRDTARINQYLVDRDVSFLFLNRQTKGTGRSLFLDDEFAIGLAVDHLVELGHEKFAAITGLSSMETGRRRRQGFIIALERAGLPCRPEHVVESDYSFAGGQAAFAQVRELENAPTALVVSEFATGIGALLAAREAGVSVPGDLSIAVFNNLEIASYLTPTVTTVGLQLSALGAEGVELLVDRLPSEEINQTVSKLAELFIRDSTGRPSRRDAPPRTRNGGLA
jgi:LacI family transcriptional regulator, galactose operon repressor